MGKATEYTRVEVDKLIPYVNNAKQHSDSQVTKIASSIREFGFLNPVLIDSSYNVIAGHGRILAAKKLGLTEVPCLFVEGLTEAQRKAYILADNRLSELGEWDMELVMGELAELDELGFDTELTGFEFEAEPEITDDEDDVPEPPTEPKAKLGDLYQLGDHRLICGDSTDVAVIDRLMDGVKADMVFTDPPYGMKKESDGVLNDNLNYDDLLDFNRQWIPLTFGALKDNGSWYCWGIDEPLMDIYSNILKPMQKENKITFRNLITWDKGNGQGQLSEKHTSYAIADEKCLFVACGKTVLHINSWKKKFDERFRPLLVYLQEQKKKCGWDTEQLKTIAGCDGKVADHWTTTDQWRVPPKDVYEKWRSWAMQHNIDAFGRPHEELVAEQNKIKEEYEKERTYFDNTHDNMNNVWHFDRAGKDEREHTGGHATPKPIALCSRAIKSSSREGEIVLDVFGGSGSTLIACEQLNRKCFMCELDPKYIDVIIERWENLTGEKAVLISE